MTRRQTKQTPADAQLEEILAWVKYVGAEPEPSEDVVMAMVLNELRATRDRRAN